MTTAALALIPAPAAVGELARLADAVATELGLEPSMLTVDMAELAGDRYFALYCNEFDSPQALGAHRRHAHPRDPDGRRQVAAFDADAARARSVEGVEPPLGPLR